MAKVQCRVCLAIVDRKHGTDLFSEKNWANRVTKLLEVPVSQSDGFPSYICRWCRRCVETIQTKIERLQELITHSYSKFSSTSRKRTKCTSGSLGVSLATAAARPPTKRTALQRRQLFPADDDSSGMLWIKK